MAQGGWRIKAWDRAVGRGVITCEQLGDLSFDGSAATVDDFVIGEPVEITLDRSGGGRRVTLIWPDDPRFAPRTQPEGPVPPLDTKVAAAAAAVLSRVPWTVDYRVHSWLGDDLTLEGDDDAFSYGARLELRIKGVVYIELPSAWSGRPFRLADERERSYVGMRCELDAATLVVRIVGDDRQIFFIAGAELEWRAKKAG